MVHSPKRREKESSMKTAIYVAGEHEEAIERQLIACHQYVDMNLSEDACQIYKDDTKELPAKEKLLQEADQFDHIICYDGDLAAGFGSVAKKVITVSNEVAPNVATNSLRDTYASVSENMMLGNFVGGMSEAIDTIDE